MVSLLPKWERLRAEPGLAAKEQEELAGTATRRGHVEPTVLSASGRVLGQPFMGGGTLIVPPHSLQLGMAVQLGDPDAELDS
nr:hypothetical protein [Actinomadura sp. NEAU-AAG7]